MFKYILMHIWMSVCLSTYVGSALSTVSYMLLFLFAWFSTTGVIVRFLPFESTEESFFYDDAPYWQVIISGHPHTVIVLCSC